MRCLVSDDSRLMVLSTAIFDLPRAPIKPMTCSMRKEPIVLGSSLFVACTLLQLTRLANCRW